MRNEPRAKVLLGLVLLAAALAIGCPKNEPCDLCDAVIASDVAKVRALAPSAKEEDKHFSLGLALRNWQPGAGTEIALVLIDAGANPNGELAFKSMGRTTATFLELAAMTNVDIVKRMIGKGADAKGRPGGFALIRAAESSRTETVKALLDAGADVSFEWKGETPLGAAQRQGDAEMVKLLKERGATK